MDEDANGILVNLPETTQLIDGKVGLGPGNLASEAMILRTALHRGWEAEQLQICRQRGVLNPAF